MSRLHFLYLFFELFITKKGLAQNKSFKPAQPTDKAYLKQGDRLCFLGKEQKREIAGTPQGNLFHILDGGSEQALLGNLRKPPHTTITETV